MNNTCSSRTSWIVLWLLWAFGISAVAQQDIYQGPLPYQFQAQPAGPTAAGAAQSSTPFMGNSLLAGPVLNHEEEEGSREPLLTWGPVRLYPQLSDTLTYGNGLLPDPGLNATTAIDTISANLLLRFGRDWSLVWTPSETIYSNPDFRNTTGERVVLHGSTTNGNWVLGLSQSYIDVTQPLVETGTQVEQVAYLTSLNANWQMSSHLSLQLALTQNFRSAVPYSDLHEWTTTEWLNYQFNRIFGAAIGVTGGYDDVIGSSGMPFEEGLARVNFAPGDKLTLAVTGGLQERQFVDPSAPTLVAPIFNAEAHYQVLDGTALEISGSRTVVPSFFGNEVNVETSAAADIRQRVIGRMFLTLSGTYMFEPFTAVVPGHMPYFGVPLTTYLQQVRTDNRTNVRLTLSTVIHTRLDASLFYLHAVNSSTQAGFSYSGNQVGLELNYRF
jgi:hypothetical protein